MSGGVDSSVTAAVLKEQGFDVVGMTLQLYDHGQATTRANTCCAGRDIRDARRVAEALGIPHYVLDYEDTFERDVIVPFAEAYVRGETPIPCVQCNRTVKFRDLIAAARELDADALATGHYARRVDGPHGPELWRGREHRRDQSYFLFATTREQLAFLRFPLGDLDKDETRAIARRLSLSVADKPDSQDICFVPEGKYLDVLERLRPGALARGAPSPAGIARARSAAAGRRCRGQPATSRPRTHWMKHSVPASARACCWTATALCFASSSRTSCRRSGGRAYSPACVCWSSPARSSRGTSSPVSQGRSS